MEDVLREAEASELAENRHADESQHEQEAELDNDGDDDDDVQTRESGSVSGIDDDQEEVCAYYGMSGFHLLT